MNLSWRDPSAGIAALLVLLVGGLLVLHDPVPDQLWALLPIVAGFLFGTHAALGGVAKGQNGTTSHGSGTASSPSAPSSSVAPASSAAAPLPPTFGGTAPSAPADGSTP